MLLSGTWDDNIGLPERLISIFVQFFFLNVEMIDMCNLKYIGKVSIERLVFLFSSVIYREEQVRLCRETRGSSLPFNTYPIGICYV